MGRRGAGYGSEDHLRCYLEERPDLIERKSRAALGLTQPIEWLAFPLTKTGDREFRGLEFLKDTGNDEALRAWALFWPPRGRAQAWDLVGRSGDQWVLVEAKASWPEFVTTRCKAQGDGYRKIRRTLGRVQRDLGVNRWFDWTETYYQHANRLAVLWFLRQESIEARLLGIYFTGDRFPDGTPCPRTKRDWEDLIEARRLTMGLPRRHRLSALEHHLFLPALKRA
jgi:hypothetical protein